MAVVDNIDTHCITDSYLVIKFYWAKHTFHLRSSKCSSSQWRRRSWRPTSSCCWPRESCSSTPSSTLPTVRRTTWLFIKRSVVEIISDLRPQYPQLVIVCVYNYNLILPKVFGSVLKDCLIGNGNRKQNSISKKEWIIIIFILFLFPSNIHRTNLKTVGKYKYMRHIFICKTVRQPRLVF